MDLNLGVTEEEARQALTRVGGNQHVSIVLVVHACVWGSNISSVTFAHAHIYTLKWHVHMHTKMVCIWYIYTQAAAELLINARARSELPQTRR
jgi:hypothetical protein